MAGISGAGRGRRYRWRPTACPPRISPTPHHARGYNPGATRFVACRIKLADAAPLGDKIKARSCVVLHEVTIDGEQVAP